MIRPLIVGLLSGILLASIACSSSGTNGTSDGESPSGNAGTSGTPSGTCGKAGRSGETSSSRCGKCTAGQYCDDGPAECKPGCTSDNNCGESEHCVRCGTDAVGTCQSCSRTDADACNAAQACSRNTLFDKNCVSPGKAYECPNTTSEPQGVGTCTQTNDPQVFCCGGAANNCTRDTQLDQPVCQGKQAYSCPPNEQPPGTCKVGVDGATYCCN